MIGNQIAGFYSPPTLPVIITGGTLYSDSTYYYRAFTSSGTLAVNQPVNFDILVVAGGGAGGSALGAGGGAGGLLTFTSQSLNGSYTCTVGAGGASVAGSEGYAGNNSQFGSLTACVGGGAQVSGNGGNGGSGGGANGYPNGVKTAGLGTSGQGNNGGVGWSNNTSLTNSGAGGGAGAVGGAGTSGGAGSGGIGGTSAFINTIGAATGLGELYSSNYYFAGGGGSAGQSGPESTGGKGGGGRGGLGRAGVSGTANTGGGGGGGGFNPPDYLGGSGGSGVIVVRYLKADV